VDYVEIVFPCMFQMLQVCLSCNPFGRAVTKLLGNYPRDSWSHPIQTGLRPDFSGLPPERLGRNGHVNNILKVDTKPNRKLNSLKKEK
jgi:hypothetical protein